MCVGAQLHQLTQVGLSSRIAMYPGVGRSVSGPSGSSWAQYRSEEEVSRPGNNRDAVSQICSVVKLAFPVFFGAFRNCIALISEYGMTYDLCVITVHQIPHNSDAIKYPFVEKSNN